MSESSKGEEQEKTPQPLWLVEVATSTRGLYQAQEDALNIHNRITAALREAPHEVPAPAGQLFSITPRYPGQAVRVGKFYPPGIHPRWGNGSALLYEQRIVTSADDPPFLADKLVVAGKDILGVNPDGSARELIIGNENFEFVVRPDTDGEDLRVAEG